MNHIFYGTVITLLYFMLYPTTIRCKNVSTSIKDHEKNEGLRLRLQQMRMEMERDLVVQENATAENSLDILNDVNFDTEMAPGVNELLNKTDRMKMLLDLECSLLPDDVVEMKTIRDEIKLLWTYNTNAIGGNVFTLEETKAVIEGFFAAGGNYLRETKEVKNHYKAIDYVEAVVRDQRELSEIEICEIHSIVLRDILPNQAGKYREVDVFITGGVSTPPSAKYVHQLMDDLLRWYHDSRNTNIHPIKKIAIFYARFEMIHPFVDGNGRTGRLIMNLELIKLGYPPSIIQAEFKNEYYSALRKAFLHNSYFMMTVEVVRSMEYAFHRYFDVLDVTVTET